MSTSTHGRASTSSADSDPIERRRTQAERSETTTEDLIGAARRLFATKGFPATSIQEIVDEAGVTRGAMYHHFTSKEQLFEAVFEREQEHLGRRVHEAASRKRGAWAQLKAGCDEFLDAALDPETQRILLIDARAVLGAQRIQEIDEAHAIQLLTMVIEKAMDEGTLRKRAVMPLVQLL
ncbi:MAG: TetR family transcriptional regulator, partial [Actinomycetota bacterium]|nr:TetR family transcriptional regulator [Actinomycetota bacterium]